MICHQNLLTLNFIFKFVQLVSEEYTINYLVCKSFQELNRVRQAILSFGFNELLPILGDLLDRECTQLPEAAHPSASQQLIHAAKMIRHPDSLQYDNKIAPLNSNNGRK